jgi:hypothetical protein
LRIEDIVVETEIWNKVISLGFLWLIERSSQSVSE